MPERITVFPGRRGLEAGTTPGLRLTKSRSSNQARALGLRLVATCFVLISLAGTFPSRSQTAPATVPPVPGMTLEQIRRQLESGHTQAALDALNAFPKGADVDRLRGEALYALGHYRKADEAFGSALVADPRDLVATQWRGVTLFRLGRPADAIPLLEHAQNWTPETHSDPAYILALCYVDTRRYDDARRAFAVQYGFAPESAAAHLLAARMLLRREYVPIAKEEAQKALAADPRLPLAHLLLGEIALASTQTDEAIREFEAERSQNPLNGAVYDRLGDAYSRKADYRTAQQSLQRAILLDPTATGPYILLGKVLLKQGDAASAFGYLEHARGMDPANYMTHSLLGQAYRAMGRVAEAQRETEASQKLQAAAEPRFAHGSSGAQ